MNGKKNVKQNAKLRRVDFGQAFSEKREAKRALVRKYGPMSGRQRVKLIKQLRREAKASQGAAR